jgi:hypothetical protein
VAGWSSGLRKSYHFAGLGCVESDDDDVLCFGLSGVLDEVEMMEEEEEKRGVEVVVLSLLAVVPVEEVRWWVWVAGLRR